MREDIGWEGFWRRTEERAEKGSSEKGGKEKKQRYDA